MKLSEGSLEGQKKKKVDNKIHICKIAIFLSSFITLRIQIKFYDLCQEESHYKWGSIAHIL